MTLYILSILISSFISNNVSSFRVPISSSFSRIKKTRTTVRFASKEETKTDEERELLNETDEIDFPAWVKGLRQWPLYPTKTEITQEEEKEAIPRSWTTRVPLSNLINVETLLEATGENTLKETLLEVTGDNTLKNNPDLPHLEIDSQIYLKDEVENVSNNVSEESPLPFFSILQELGAWENVVLSLQQSISELANTTAEESSTANLTEISSTIELVNETKATTNISEISNTAVNQTSLSSTISESTESILREATKGLEYLVSEVSTKISPQIVQEVILQAGQSINLNLTNDMLETAEQAAVDQGLDVHEAAEQARERTQTAYDFVTTANALLVAGYAKEETAQRQKMLIEEENSARTLFEDFSSARLLAGRDIGIFAKKVAEMGSLCGAIYADTIPVCHKWGHSIVTNSTTANVAWMVTDSITSEKSIENGQFIETPKLVRTITIKGFDASDESVDREELLVNICTASQEEFGPGLLVHTGLLKIAREILKDIMVFIDNSAPGHEIMLNGHSVGGSLCTLILLLLAEERGSDFVSEKISRVYTFGSPPVISVANNQNSTSHVPSSESEKLSRPKAQSNIDMYKCDVLSRFGLPASKVFTFLQPWDPIPRLFSGIDPLYPLLGDLGEDGKTLYASGPPRTLRPLTRAIFESWEGWPRFRDSFRATVSQNYSAIGIQHLLLPEPVRYLSDRLVSVNVQVPPLDSIVRISAEDLLPALNSSFPLDVFSISFVPAAVRSFIHHFYPAYEFPIVEYAEKKEGIVPSVDIAKLEKDFKKTEEAIQNNDKSIGSQWLQFPPDW